MGRRGSDGEDHDGRGITGVQGVRSADLDRATAGADVVRSVGGGGGVGRLPEPALPGGVARGGSIGTGVVVTDGTVIVNAGYSYGHMTGNAMLVFEVDREP